MEITRLKSICHTSSDKQDSKSISWSDFKTPEARKSLLIGMVLMTLNQFSGVPAMLAYSDDIINEAGVDVAPAISAVLISLLQIIGAYIPTVLSDRAGRKVCDLFTQFSLVHRL